jgi:hypothetical protein
MAKFNKTDKKIVCAIFLIIVIVFGINTAFWYKQESYVKKSYGCYMSHVQECLYCQKQNLTYLLCSGFCVPPSPQDLDGKGCPVIHPSKNCFDLPRECVLD